MGYVSSLPLYCCTQALIPRAPAALCVYRMMLSHWLTVLDKDPQSIAQLVKSQLVAMATEVSAAPQPVRMLHLRMPHCLHPETHMLIVFLPDYYSMLGPLHLLAPLTSLLFALPPSQESRQTQDAPWGETFDALPLSGFGYGHPTMGNEAAWTAVEAQVLAQSQTPCAAEGEGRVEGMVRCFLDIVINQHRLSHKFVSTPHTHRIIGQRRHTNASFTSACPFPP